VFEGAAVVEMVEKIVINIEVIKIEAEEHHRQQIKHKNLPQRNKRRTLVLVLKWVQ
jgi:hypothetical protein